MLVDKATTSPQDHILRSAENKGIQVFCLFLVFWTRLGQLNKEKRCRTRAFKIVIISFVSLFACSFLVFLVNNEKCCKTRASKSVTFTNDTSSRCLFKDINHH